VPDLCVQKLNPGGSYETETVTDGSSHLLAHGGQRALGTVGPGDNIAFGIEIEGNIDAFEGCASIFVMNTVKYEAKCSDENGNVVEKEVKFKFPGNL
jgi:hypothetical protein